MTTLANELAFVAQRLRELASRTGAFVLEALPEDSRYGNGALLVRLELTAFERLLASVKPRILYLLEERFDADQAIVDVAGLEDDCVEAAIEALPPAIRAFRQRAARRAGFTSLVVASAVVDGVVHSTTLEALWLREFEEELVGLLSQERTRKAAIHDVRRAAKQPRLS